MPAQKERTMCQLKRLAELAAVAGAGGPAAMIVLGVATATADPSEQPDPNSAVRVEFGATKRDCDFNPVGAPRTPQGTGFAIIGTTPNEVTAEVHLMNAASNATYSVRLIELPSSTCSPDAPGVGVETIETDPSGNGTVTVKTALGPGVTGTWVTVLDGSGQLYTSNTVAPVVAGPLTTQQIDSLTLPTTP